jgi:hypothetical protein
VIPLKRVPRIPLELAAYPSLLRWCGVAGILSGVLFAAWGYIDKPNNPEDLMSVVHILAFVVPALLLAVVIGLCLLWRNRLGKLGWLVIALAGYALGWSLVGASVGGEAVWVYFAQRGWPHYLSSWLLFMLISLTLIGISTVRSGLAQSRVPSALVLATGVFGWPYYMTNSGAILEARWAHIGFGLLFSLSWVALGVGLLVAGTRRAKRPQEPA